jgi:hypothetical protein
VVSCQVFGRPCAAAVLLVVAIGLMAPPVLAQDAPDGGAPPTRPVIMFNRWEEDWSVLADPALRTEPLDDLKYIHLSAADPDSYVSFGAGLRERYEHDTAAFGVIRQPSQNYLLQRAELDADIHPDADWQIFTQLQADRAFWKHYLTPVDQDQLDIEQAFVAYKAAFLDGLLKLRVGRQEMGFDLQRFVSARDGPNVRQAYDAVWADWEQAPWRVIGFWSHPVQTINVRPFDDYSSGHFQYGGFRVERQEVGPGSLSAYFSQYDQDSAHYLFASGAEQRNIGDVHYGGKKAGFDWDFEAMGQMGSVGLKSIAAWALGELAGYTFEDVSWQPRLGLQVDVASGNQHPNGNTLGTFNPLFPNGYYLNLSGYTGEANLIHVKPSLTLSPIEKLKLLVAAGLLWRATTADAVYTQPNIPVPDTAGRGSLWTGIYNQLRADYQINANLTGAIEAVHYTVGETIRGAGGHNDDYLGVELKFGW